MKDYKEVREFIEKNGVKFVDFKFNDLPGLWQHFSMPVSAFDERAVVEGVGFDGSSIRGFQKINESDMILKPDLSTAVLDPVCEIPTLSIVCDIYDPTTQSPYTRDPRYVAKKAEQYLKDTGIADVSYWGPEMEFFIFDDVRFDQKENFGFYYVDSVEGEWNSGKEEMPNLGYKPRFKEGYFPVPPHDSLQDIRSEMVETLEKCGIPVEVHHHEVASGGQGEIDMVFDSLARMGYKCMMYKYIVKNIARKHGKTATFMPKPLFGDNGSGMHIHISLWKGDKNLFYDPKGYAEISELGLYFIGGLLKHIDSLLAFCAPTTNSYKRLVPGYEAPVHLAYSKRNRSAAIRIPVYHTGPRSKRIEFRPPDPSANPYLCFSAILMAGLDGIRNRIHPGDPIDKDIYHELTPEERARVKQVPGSLAEALEALEKDHQYLLEGDVFTRDVIEVWLEYKWKNEVEQINIRPHPYEFYLYFDV